MKNWKTTVCGLLGGAIVVVIPILQGGKFSLRDLAIAAAIGVLGAVAKDLNVTGT